MGIEDHQLAGADAASVDAAGADATTPRDAVTGGDDHSLPRADAAPASTDAMSPQDASVDVVSDTAVTDTTVGADGDANVAEGGNSPDATDGASSDVGTLGPCPTGCGMHQTCSGTGAAAACTCNASICSQPGTTCQDAQTLATCVVDSDGCPYVASTSTCPGGQSCSGAAPSAVCSVTCMDSCSSGQSSCVSAGSLATCTRGSNGCLSYGTPAACPGARQSCSGSAGAASCTCNTSSTCPSVAPTCADPSTVAVCAQDSYGCFYESTTNGCSGGTPACLGGMCVPCSPGATQCSGLSAQQTCTSGGTWGSATSCTSNQTCVGTACGGQCGQGQTQCASATQPQTCSSSGTWQNATACTSSQSCVSGSCVTPPPSCQTSGLGTSQCGSANESCCTSLEVTGGTYYRTYTNSGGGPTGEADPATVSSFRLDKYLVTVGRFQQFVTAWNGGNGWTPPAGSGKHTHLNGGQGLANSASAGTYESGWLTSDNSNVAPTDANLGCDPGISTWGYAANLPIDCANWYEAFAFCIWDGGFLPSEAEWEYAAAGGSQQLEYPWGSAAPGTANQYAIYNCDYPNGPGSCTTRASIAPVGTAIMGAGLWGQLDLVGEMLERTSDWYNGSYIDPCTDCAYLTVPANPYRVCRGGPFDYSAAALLPPYRISFMPAARGGDIGFRCARTP